MKNQQTGFLRYLVLLILVFTLVRFAPLLVRVIQATILGARAFWWAVLPVLIFGAILWRAARRQSHAKKSDDQFKNQRLRDVTDSVKDRSV